MRFARNKAVMRKKPVIAKTCAWTLSRPGFKRIPCNWQRQNATVVVMGGMSDMGVTKWSAFLGPIAEANRSSVLDH